MKTLLFDIETDGLMNPTDGSKPMSTVHMIAAEDADTGEEFLFLNRPFGTPRDIERGIDFLAKADRLVAQRGILFDVPALNWWDGRNLLKWRKVFDTMVTGRLLDPEERSHSLEAQGLRVGCPKGQQPDSWEHLTQEMIDYCKQDVKTLKAIYLDHLRRLNGYSERCIRLEHDVHYIIGQQIDNGFGFDVEGARALLAELQAEKADVHRQLLEAFPPVRKSYGWITPKVNNAKLGRVKGVPYEKVEIETFNPGSRMQTAERLIAKYKWKPTKFTPTGIAEISESVLEELPFPEAKLLAQYLRLEKMIGMLAGEKKKNGTGGGWLNHVTPAGRIHGSVNSNGARTSRMTHSRPNVAQADKDKRMRRLWIPRPGWKLVGTDAEGLELRMMAHYLYPWDKGAFGRMVDEGKKEDGTDVHTVNQKILGLYSRNSPGAKTFIYALIYGAGDAKLGAVVIEDAIAEGRLNPTDSPHLYTWVEKKPKRPYVQHSDDRDEVGTVVTLPAEAGKWALRSKTDIGKEARDKIGTGIVGFKELVAAVKFKVQKQGYIMGPDGRRLYCDSPHAALNTLFQGAGAIVMKVALCAYHDTATGELDGDYRDGTIFAPLWQHGRDFAYCANVHDEVQQEAPPMNAELAGNTFAESIAVAGKWLGIKCPLKGAYDVGTNWSETH